MTITLPFPPSANAYWRSIVRGKHASVITSKDGREYQKACESRLRAGGVTRLAGPCAVEIAAYFPNRRGDLDNRIKPVLDVLQGHAFENDSQVEHLSITRHIDKDDPRVEVTVFELQEAA